jgi:acyl-CoA thioesterase
MDAANLARACADAMWADDATCRELGMQLISAEPGHAVLAMAVTEKMVNWHNTCHGGFIFLLADTAFGYACNSYTSAWWGSTAASAISTRRKPATA